ncbi:cytochrome c maturation protein CcmE [Nesterenkonia lutea]|uniref:Cytochrome c-type biogenesis protein CcmE n=1 Tax=Nesterenkonia lutea TaxID=272919 RepID=A0ABR9JCF1_9MICC|nr:cytochrome c maturation protein CcmE [Nesterenkonia lutea]MBE1523453.1 cytochrome c-type biogenesis protein CcmE [Nesterenkonia lutea]
MAQEPSSGERRPRAIRLGVLVAACAGVVALGLSAAEDGISYYRTPSELEETVQEGAVQGGDGIRLGGMVVTGSLVESPGGSRMVVTDGARDVAVRYPGRFPDVVREGEGAVIDGILRPDGTIDAETIVLRHSNEYRAPEAQEP